ncbi:MAG: ABC transporter permease subunit [Synechococcales bacterium]|nr:ABC transporter permease subunit [Synechococcales bacterium]
MTASDLRPDRKPPIWRDERFWKIAFQVITLAVVVGVLAILITNLNRNLIQQGNRFGFSFLRNAAGFGIGESLVDYQPQDPYTTVILAGIVNSLRAIAVGIITATVVGVMAGVASFSENWLVYKISRAYVGLVRNVPLLLQLFFWYFAIFFQLPPPQEQIEFLGLAVLSKRGVYLPGPSLSDENWLGLVLIIAAVLLSGLLVKLVRDAWQGGFLPGIRGMLGRITNGAVALPVLAIALFLVVRGLGYLVAGEGEAPLGAGAWIPIIVVGIVAIVFIWRQRVTAIVDRGSTGQPQLAAMGAIAAATLIIFIFGLGWHAPEVLDTGGVTGGLRLSLEYAAAVTGLTFYTGAFIAEIVRGGIQAVSKGQWEAARSLGLPPGLVMRLVVFPQALRVIIPPLNSEYMNLAKNSTLAFAIGYPELYSVSSTTFNQTGRPIEIFIIIIATYLILNLLISLCMNQLNSLVQLKER